MTTAKKATTGRKYTPEQYKEFARQRTEKAHATTVQRYNDIRFVQDNRNYTRDEFFDRITTLGNPYNMDRGYHYKGVNVIVLTIRALVCNYSTNQWLTFRGAKANGWNIKKGEKATTVYVVKPKINGHTVTWEVYHDYAVANGLDPYHPEDTMCTSWPIFNLDQCQTSTDGVMPERHFETIDVEAFTKDFNEYAKRTRESYDKVREIKPGVFEVETNPISTDVVTEPTAEPAPTTEPEAPKLDASPVDDTAETVTFKVPSERITFALKLDALRYMNKADMAKMYKNIISKADDQHVNEMVRYFGQFPASMYKADNLKTVKSWATGKTKADPDEKIIARVYKRNLKKGENFANEMQYSKLGKTYFSDSYILVELNKDMGISEAENHIDMQKFADRYNGLNGFTIPTKEEIERAILTNKVNGFKKEYMTMLLSNGRTVNPNRLKEALDVVGYDAKGTNTDVAYDPIIFTSAKGKALVCPVRVRS